MSSPSTLRRAAFALLCVLQLAAAGSGIARYEHTLRSGTEVWLEVAPVDPADPFRGRYVSLTYALEREPHPVRGTPNYKDHVYAVLKAEKGRAAKVLYVAAQEPTSGLYLKVLPSWADGDRIHINIPFDRYYMEESLAPAAEVAYREAVGTQVFDDQGNRSSEGGRGQQSFARMRILGGRAVIEGVLLGDVPIETAARTVRARGGH
jgi:uncharacterized membrane-anchored protein